MDAMGKINPSESAFDFQLSLVLAGDPKDPAKKRKNAESNIHPSLFLGLGLNLADSYRSTIHGTNSIFTYIEWLFCMVNDGKFVRKV